MALTSNRPATFWRRVVSLLALTACSPAILGGVAAGSQAEKPTDSAAESGRPVLTSREVEVPAFAHDAEAARSMWIWNAGNRGYLLGFVDGRGTGGYTQLGSVDLASGRQVGMLRLPDRQSGWKLMNAVGYAAGLPAHAAVDEQSGVLFIPYRGVSRQEPGIPVSARVPGGGQCIEQDARYGCLAGVHVVDAERLEIVRSIPLRLVSAEAGMLSQLGLRAMQFAPARRPEERPKVLLLVESLVQSPTSSSDTPRYNGLNMVYVVQLDVESGTQEWVARIDACRGNRDTAANDEGTEQQLSNPGALLRSPDLDDPAVWVACHSPGRMATLVRLPLDDRGFVEALPVAVADPAAVPGGDVSPAELVRVPAAPVVVQGPAPTVGVIADPPSQRFALRVNNNKNSVGEAWWVFDGRARSFVGTIGVGRQPLTEDASTIDPASGRLYLHYPFGKSKGLFIADIRRTPLPQALVYPEFAGLVGNQDAGANGVDAYPIAVRSSGPGRPPELFLRRGRTGPYHVVVDHVPPSVDPLRDDFAGRTLDLPEVEGVTNRELDGAARGFAARAIVLGGAEGLTRFGPADPLGTVYLGLRNSSAGHLAPPDGCSNQDRDVVVSFVGPSGPAVVDGNGSRGGAVPVVVDQGTRADAEAPMSRCSRRDWKDLWSGALFGRPPVGEVAAPWPFGEGTAECVSGSDSPSAAMGDPVTGAFAAGVDCAEGEASGFSYARGLKLGELGLSEALASFRIYRDPARGIVSRVESVARGVQLAGLFKIDTVRASAESWANGRRQPVPEADREAGYRANCDVERSAGSCYQRHLFGVWTPAYRCGPCGDEGRLIEGLNRALGANGRASLRNPDPRLARGAENGYTAAIQKPEIERFGDLVLNSDLLQTVVPALEIVRLTTSGARGTGTRGQQLYQLAGVEASSSYAIQCLLEYDPVANTCVAASASAASIEVTLADASGSPLAGGAFELRVDGDRDGVLGLGDVLAPSGACLTAADGVGTCRFDGVEPGAYLVSQVAAPPGYSKAAEPFAVEVGPGERRTVAFTNASNQSTVQLHVVDEAGAAVAGATFAAYPDPDGDGKVAPQAEPAATCTTNQAGGCAMTVPAGSYVLVQTAAPGGLAPIEPVAFAFASGGQTAAVAVVNYPPDAAAPPAAAPAPVYTPAVEVAPPVESAAPYHVAESAADESAVAPPVSVPDAVGGTIVRVMRAPGDALRLLSRDSKEAAAWTAALALFALAMLAVRRRALLAGLAGVPVVAFRAPPGAGGAGPQGPHTPRPSPGTSGAAVDTRTPVARPRRGLVAGASAPPVEHQHVEVVVVTADAGLAAVLSKRLAEVDRCDVVATAGSVRELASVLPTTSADAVVVADLALPSEGDHGICDEIAALFRADRVVGIIPGTRSAEALVRRACIVGLGGLLTAYDDLSNGQVGYAVRCVATGKPYFGPTVQRIMMTSWVEVLRQGEGVQLLTQREIEIARLAVHGLSRTAIAKKLYLSPHTVKRHLRAARAKLGVTDPQAVAELRQRMADAGIAVAESGNGES